MIVFFDDKLALFPEAGSITIIVIPSETLKGLASDFLIPFFIKLSKIGSAVFLRKDDERKRGARRDERVEREPRDAGIF